MPGIERNDSLVPDQSAAFPSWQGYRRRRGRYDRPPFRLVAVSLLMDTRAAVAELMAECPRCGAITTLVLEIAWRTGPVGCGRQCGRRDAA